MKTCVPIHNRIHNLENSTTKKEKKRKFPKYFTKQKKNEKNRNIIEKKKREV